MLQIIQIMKMRTISSFILLTLLSLSVSAEGKVCEVKFDSINQDIKKCEEKDIVYIPKLEIDYLKDLENRLCNFDDQIRTMANAYGTVSLSCSYIGKPRTSR